MHKRRGDACARVRSSKAREYEACIEHWYEALRVLAISWEEREDGAAVMLRMNNVHALCKAPSQWPAPVRNRISSFTTSLPPTMSYPRLSQLKLELAREYEERGDQFRGIIFVEQRIMAHMLKHVVESDVELRTYFRPACLTATNTPATSTLNVTAAQSKDRLSDFASGPSIRSKPLSFAVGPIFR